MSPVTVAAGGDFFNKRRMIFPLRVFGSESVKRMSSGLASEPICWPTWPRSSSFRLGVGLTPLFQSHEGNHALALQFVGRPTDGGFGDFRMTDQRAFDFGGAEAMAGDVEHIIDRGP